MGKPLLTTFVLGALLLACSASEEAPSTGTYTLQFPSTAAAVATDTVQLLFFDVLPTPAERTAQCANIIQARKRKDLQKPAFQNTSVNVCELALGKKPVTIPYGEHVVFAIAVRTNADFMVGCNIQTFGQGNAPLPIAMSLVDVSNPVPDTTCGSVSDFCAKKCPAN